MRETKPCMGCWEDGWKAPVMDQHGGGGGGVALEARREPQQRSEQGQREQTSSQDTADRKLEYKSKATDCWLWLVSLVGGGWWR